MIVETGSLSERFLLKLIYLWYIHPETRPAKNKHSLILFTVFARTKVGTSLIVLTALTRLSLYFCFYTDYRCLYGSTRETSSIRIGNGQVVLMIFKDHFVFPFSCLKLFWTPVWHRFVLLTHVHFHLSLISFESFHMCDALPLFNMRVKRICDISRRCYSVWHCISR